MSSPEREVLYDGRIVKLGLETTTLPNGRAVRLEIVRHQGAAAIVPIDEHDHIFLIHQHRHAAGGMIYEIPAGVLEPGEDPQDCAVRELAEEAQLAPAQVERLGTILTTPGFTDERIHLFVGRGVHATDIAQPEWDEYIEVVRVPAVEALAMVRDGRIQDAKTIAALHLALCAR